MASHCVSVCKVVLLLVDIRADVAVNSKEIGGEVSDRLSVVTSRDDLPTCNALPSFTQTQVIKSTPGTTSASVPKIAPSNTLFILTGPVGRTIVDTGTVMCVLSLPVLLVVGTTMYVVNLPLVLLVLDGISVFLVCALDVGEGLTATRSACVDEK